MALTVEQIEFVERHRLRCRTAIQRAKAPSASRASVPRRVSSLLSGKALEDWRVLRAAGYSRSEAFIAIGRRDLVDGDG